MIRRLAILLLVCGGLGFFLQREQSRGSFDAWERRWLAQVQRVEGPRPTAPPVVLIELRRGDLPFESWPPAPLDYALVFESLVRRQPRQVVVQPLLAWPGVEPLDAATLAERIALLPRGVLACTLQRGLDEWAGTPAAVPLPALPGASGDISRVPDFAAPGQVPVEELRLGKALGFTRIEFGQGIAVEGGSVALPLLARRGSELVPSLALQALLAWYEAAPGDVMIQLGRRLTLGSVVEMPIDGAGRLHLTSRLAPPLRRLDAGALLIDLERDAKLMAERPTELETLRSLDGALVVLGETGETTPRFQAPGAPEGGWTEAEVLARSLVAALSGFYLREPDSRWLWAGWGVVMLAGAALLGCPRRWLPVFAVGGAMALILACALCFLNGQWWIPPVPPLGLWGAACLVAFILPPARPPAAAAPVAPPVAAEPGAPAVAATPVAEAALAPDTASSADATTAMAMALPEDATLDALTGEWARDESPDDGNGSQSGDPPHLAASAVTEPSAGGVSPLPPEDRAAAKPIKPGRKGHRSGRGRPMGGGRGELA